MNLLSTNYLINKKHLSTICFPLYYTIEFKEDRSNRTLSARIILATEFPCKISLSKQTLCQI